MTGKPTKGPARVTRGKSQMCDKGTTIWHSGEWGVYSDADEHGGDKADAELICESFNVYHETGLTPRQLLDRLENAENFIRSLEAVREKAKP